MSKIICSIDKCNSPHHALNFCRNHCYAFKKYGDALINKRDGTPNIAKNGYMIICINGKSVLHHRFIWSQTNGPIPPGYVVHHKNNIKHDNRLENLELLQHNAHAKHHHPKGGKRLKLLTYEQQERRNKKHKETLRIKKETNPRVCSVYGCQKEHQGRGFCNTHYQRWKKHGNPLLIKRPLRDEATGRLISRDHPIVYGDIPSPSKIG